MTASSSGWPGQTKAASGWPCGATELLLEGDPLVAGQHRLADTDQAVAVAHRGRNVRDLVAARLALLGRPPRSRNASWKNDSM